MGNQLYKDYAFDENPVASGGPSFLWKVYSGQNRNTNEKVSIFICHIKDIEARFGKNNVPQVLNHFRREAAVLTKIRHPLVLNPIQPLIETRTELAMITEPVLGSVSNLLLKRYTHITDVKPEMEKFELHNLEMKFGMCQVMEALAFCHQNTHLVHGNVTPHQIFITPKGQWKLSGFHFSFHSDSTLDGNPKGPLGNPSASQPTPGIIPPEFDEIVHFGTSITKSNFLPSLDYAAPEYVLSKAPSFCSDIFSFGLLYCQLLRANGRTHGRQSVPDDGDDDASSSHSSTTTNTLNNPSMPLLNTYQNIEKYNASIRRLHDQLRTNESFQKLSPEIHDSLMGLCSLESTDRPTAHFILSHCELLFGMEVKALRYLNNMEMREQVKKAQFLRSLLPMIKSSSNDPSSSSSNIGFPDKILFNKVLPPLLEECKDVKMTLYALPNVLAIGENMTNTQFGKLIMPTLCKFVLMYTDQQAKVPAIVLQHFETLWTKSTPTEQKNFLIPFLVRCLQSSQQDVQIEAMKRSEEWFNSEKISLHEFKSIVLPDLQLICKKTNNPTVRINAIVCLGKILPKLDKPVITNVVVPVLEHVLKQSDHQHSSTGLYMSCVGVFLKISKLEEMKSGLLELMSGRVLPAVLPIAGYKCLDKDAFEKYMRAVRSMLDLVEKERLGELEMEKSSSSTSTQHSPVGHLDDRSGNKEVMMMSGGEKSPMMEQQQNGMMMRGNNSGNMLLLNKKQGSQSGNIKVDPLQRIVMEKNQDDEIVPMQRRVVNFQNASTSSSLQQQQVGDDDSHENQSPKEEVSSTRTRRESNGAFDSLLGRFLIDDPQQSSSSSSIIQSSGNNSGDNHGGSLFKESKTQSKSPLMNIDDLMSSDSFRLAVDDDHPSPVRPSISSSSLNNDNNIVKNDVVKKHLPLQHDDPKEDSFDRMLNRMNTVVDDPVKDNNNGLFSSKYQNADSNVIPERERSDSMSDSMKSLLNNSREQDVAVPVVSSSGMMDRDDSPVVSLLDDSFDRMQSRYSSAFADIDDDEQDVKKVVSKPAPKPSTSGDMFDSLLMRHIDSDDDE